MHGVADHFADAADGRLAGAERADGGPRPLLAPDLDGAAETGNDPGRSSIDALLEISLRRSALYFSESSVSIGTFTKSGSP